MDKPVRQSETESEGRVDLAIRYVRDYIAQNRLVQGDVLPSETAMAEELGVSRAVMREAFRALSALRILQVGNGRRARVGEPDSEALSMIFDHTVYTRHLSIQQVLDVRRTLELRTASLAAMRRSEADADRLVAIANDMLTSINDPERVKLLDIEFHEVIAAASGNPLYATTIGAFRIITQQTWDISWRSRQTTANRRDNLECHARIAAAIKAQDPEAAERTMRDHFDSAVRALVNAGVN